MAGLFDSYWEGGNWEFDPKKNEVVKKGASDPAPRTGVGGRTGQYIPKEGPVAPWEGKLGPQGNVYEGEYTKGGSSGGSNIVERNMKQVGPGMKEVYGERVPNARLSGPTAAAEGVGSAGGRGLLSRAAGAVFGPIGMGVQAAVTPGELGDGTRGSDYPSYSPEEQASAGQWMKGVVDRAVSGAVPKQQAPQASQPQSVTVPQESQPSVLSPGTQEAAKAQVAQQLETQRQHIENGALAQLKDNRMSRVDAATAVVDAQAAQTGTQLKPDEHKAAVAEEVGAMRKMGNSDLATYISYALIGLGAVAAATDEKAANAFGSAFASSFGNYRNQQLQWAKFMAERQDKQFDQKLALNKDKREDRGADRDDKKFTLDEKNIGSQIDDRAHNQLIQEGRLENDTNQVGIAQQNADTSRFSANNTAALGNANLGLRQQEFALKKDMAPTEKEYKLAQVKKLGADTKKAEASEVPDMSQKDQVAAAEAELKERKIRADDGLIQQYAAEKRKLRKALPNASEDELSQIATKRLGIQSEPTSWYQRGEKTWKLQGVK